MKGFKEQVEGFKKWLAAAFAEEPAAGDITPVDSLKEYETSAGAKVKIDKLAVGGKVFQEDGTTPVIAGFVLVDGTDVQVDPTGVITAVTAPAADPSPMQFTPEQTALREIAAKFAAGTPEERIVNLEAMSQAMMQYCFGWKIDEAARKAIEEQAIAAYKTLGTPTQLSEHTKSDFEELKKAYEVKFQKQSEAIGKIATLMEQFALSAASDPVQPPSGAVDPDDTKMERAANFLKAIRKGSEEVIGAD